MNTLKRLLFLLALSLPQWTLAQTCTSWAYVGAPFTSVSTTGPNSTPVSSPLMGFVTLAAPLPANGTTVVSPTDWDFSAEWVYLNFASQDTFDTPAAFSFTTQNGVIVGWTVSVNYNNGGGVDSFNIAATSTINGDSVEADYFDADSGVAASTITGSSSAPGTWTCQTVFTADFPVVAKSAPPPATITPIVAAAVVPAKSGGGGALSWLALLGLAVLVHRRGDSSGNSL
jgi:hypothetical protein